MTVEKNIVIRPAVAGDCDAIARIYNYYVLNTTVTFEEAALTAREMEQRVDEITAASLPWLVAETAGEVTGYAYASKWNGRCAYRFSVEITVYVDPAKPGQGVGTKLYEALFARLRGDAMHVVIGGIALPNQASVALHEKFGLQKVAHFKEVGFKFNRWIDVGYWQASL